MEPTLSAPNDNLFELQIDQQCISYLSETARWARFLSIMGFILCGFMVLAAIFAGSVMTAFQNTSDGAGPFGNMMNYGGAFISIIYIGIAVLYFFPCLYLFNFAGKMRVALRHNDQQNMNASFGNLKSCFKFVGILTIVILSLYLLLLIFGISAAVLFR